MKFAITKEGAEEIQRLINELRLETARIQDQENKVKNVIQNEDGYGVYGDNLLSWISEAEKNRKDMEASVGAIIQNLEKIKSYIESLLSIDWSFSMNTDRELEHIKEMDENGDYKVPKEDLAKNEKKKRKPNIPKTTGYFDGRPGNSAFFPYSESAKRILKQYSKENVQYNNGYPDFSPFTFHKSDWGNFTFSIEIGHMTDSRKNRMIDGFPEEGNYTQAEKAFCDMINACNKNENHENMVTTTEFRSWYTNAGLMLHECEDGRTVQLVPVDLHNACPHSGGVSEQKYRMAMGDLSLPGLDQKF